MAFSFKLEIPNIMLVCKLEINWSTNKNLRALTTYLGRTDGRPAFPYPPLRFAGAGDKHTQSNLNIKANQRNLKMWPLLAVALYIQIEII